MTKKEEEKPIRVVVKIPDDIKNAAGEFGAICVFCAGYGFTYSIYGEKSPCRQCFETGVGIDLVKLQRQVGELTNLVRALYTELKKKGLTDIK